MPAAYSLDLYQKVMNAIDKGMSITTASKTFCVSRSSLHLWRKPLRSLKVTTGSDNHHNRQIGGLNYFAQFLSNRRDWTQQGLGGEYQSGG